MAGRWRCEVEGADVGQPVVVLASGTAIPDLDALPPGTVLVAVGPDGCLVRWGEMTRQGTLGNWVAGPGWRLRVSPADGESPQIVDRGGWAAPELRIRSGDDPTSAARAVKLPLRDGEELVLGRRADQCHVVVHDRFVSKRHLRVFVRDGVHFLEDVGSSGGTHVNDQPMVSPHTLRDGDRITLGKSEILFHDTLAALARSRTAIALTGERSSSASPTGPTPVEPSPIVDPLAVTLKPDAPEPPPSSLEPEPVPEPQPEPDPAIDAASAPAPPAPPPRSRFDFRVLLWVLLTILLVLAVLAGLGYLGWLVLGAKLARESGGTAVLGSGVSGPFA